MRKTNATPETTWPSTPDSELNKRTVTSPLQVGPRPDAPCLHAALLSDQFAFNSLFINMLVRISAKTLDNVFTFMEEAKILTKEKTSKQMATKLSKKFKAELKLNPEPAYRLAVQSGLHPSSLSLMIHGGRIIDREDERLVAIGQLLGLEPDEIFEAEGLANRDLVENKDDTSPVNEEIRSARK